jgi:serine phosphatase RsbU (regulator of sigma subunit)
MPTIRFENGPHNGTDFSFDNDIVIGRSRTADLMVEDASVSRRHAALKVSHGEWFIEDLGSENGTYVNGRRVTRPTCVKAGDQLTLGAIMARVAETMTRPSAASPRMAASAIDPGAAKVVLSMPAEERTAESLRLSFMNELGRITGQTFDQQALIAFVLDQLLVLFPAAERAFVLLGDETSASLVTAGTRLRAGAAPGAVLSRTLLKTAIDKREAIVVTDVQADSRFKGAESMFLAGIRSAMCAPLVFDQRVYGIIQIDRGKSTVSFDRDDMAMLVGIATHTAMALGFGRLHATVVERELIERDMMLARRIQRQFLPRELPRVPGYSVAIDYTPAMSIGGDLYDFMPLGDGLVGIAVGDVSGKGISAALYAAKLGSDLRHVAAGLTGAKTILERFNAQLAGTDTEGMFATLVLAAIDTRTHMVSVANAGHTLPIVRAADGRVSEIGSGGKLPLGLAATATFDVVTHQLEPGESITFYTDGVSEGLNEKKELFGEDRLRQAVAGAGGSADDCVRGVMAALKTFVAGAPQSDDITIVCCRRDEPSVSP